MIFKDELRFEALAHAVHLMSQVFEHGTKFRSSHPHGGLGSAISQFPAAVVVEWASEFEAYLRGESVPDDVDGDAG